MDLSFGLSVHLLVPGAGVRTLVPGQSGALSVLTVIEHAGSLFSRETLGLWHHDEYEDKIEGEDADINGIDGRGLSSDAMCEWKYLLLPLDRDKRDRVDELVECVTETDSQTLYPFNSVSALEAVQASEHFLCQQTCRYGRKPFARRYDI